jgi:hypothetical protein
VKEEALRGPVPRRGPDADGRRRGVDDAVRGPVLRRRRRGDVHGRGAPRDLGTPEEEAIRAELWDHVLPEEKPKIEAATPDRLEQLRRMTAFLNAGGLQRAREEAVRRVRARKPT